MGNKRGAKSMRNKRDNYNRKKPSDGKAWTANIMNELKKAEADETNNEKGVDTIE